MSLCSKRTSKLEVTLDKIVKKRLEALTIDWSHYFNPYTCPESFIPYLALFVKVFLWDSNWSTQRKRDAIKWTIEVRKKRGTIYALEEGLKKLDIEVDILPWWDNNDPELQTDRDFLALATANDNMLNGISGIDTEKEELIRNVCESLKPLTATFETKFMIKFNPDIEIFSLLRVYPIFNAYCEIEVQL